MKGNKEKKESEEENKKSAYGIYNGEHTEVNLNKSNKYKTYEELPDTISITPSLYKKISSTQVTNDCVLCNHKVKSSKINLKCLHSYHLGCIILHFTKKLENLKKKSSKFKCLQCNHPISFNFFIKLESISPLAKYKSNLQRLSRRLFVCPKCGLETEKFSISTKLKPKSIKCEKCKIKFCSFCSGSKHYFGCRAFKNLLNSETMGLLTK